MTRRRRPLRDTWALLSDPLESYRRLQAEHGDWVPLSLGPRPAVLISDPDLAAEVLKRDVEGFDKGFGNDALAPLVQHSVFLAEGADWRRQRPAVMAALRRAVLAPRLPLVTHRVDTMLDGWSDGDRIRLTTTVRSLSTTIAADALMGTSRLDDEPQLLRDLDAVWRELCHRLRRPLARHVPGRRRREYRAALGRVHEAVAAIVADTAAHPDDSPLATLVGSEALRDREVLSEALNLLTTGQECVAIATTWSLALLARHPDAANQVAQEADDWDGRTVESLARLEYTRAVVDEAMRLHPPAWMLTREATTDQTLGDHAMPQKTVAMICPHVMHRAASRWTDPDRFDPSRFLPGGEGRTTARRSYLPFGSGPRACAGALWARWQAVATVSRVQRKVRLQLAPDADPRPDVHPGLTLRPPDDLHVHVRERTP